MFLHLIKNKFYYFKQCKNGRGVVAQQVTNIAQKKNVELMAKGKQIFKM